MNRIVKHALFPIVFYLLAFSLLTYPLIIDFSTRFLTDAGDGLQNVWNIWWINTAVAQPGVHPSIWHTDMLHWPFGTTLLGQTLNPFNGLAAVPLLRFLSLTQTFNTLILFAFVMGGVTAYWLAYYITRSFIGSLTAGFIFTFSSYHFAHYYGHMQLVSLEWIPLFLLCWIFLLDRPHILTALTSALTLWLVLLCDYYYFFYCILAGGLIALWRMFTAKDARLFLKKEYLASLSVFIGMSLFLAGPIVFPLMYLSRIDPLLGAHKATNFSLDLLSLFIPGEGWRFGHLTEAYWSKLPVGLSEVSVYLGYSVIILLIYIWHQHRKVETTNQIGLWFMLLGFFFLMALGPALQINGKIIYSTLMPYTLLEKILPFLKLSGVPVRMVVMITLTASVLSAIALQELLAGTPQNKIIATLLLLLLAFESLPARLPSTSTEVPEYVSALAKLPNVGGVLDLTSSTRYVQLYYQTAHRKPLVFGYVSRIPTSLDEKEADIRKAVNKEDYAHLWDEYHIRYIVTTKAIEYENPFVSVKLVYQDDDTNIYRLSLNGE
ncbi:MAG: hypothetical protein IPP66_02630 [Anaerolineales bacterium]|nr:hypothetical protein [Anaerolineales bacterium]